MASIEALIGLIYGAVCFCVVVPPQEVVAAGLTIENIFGKYLGDETLDFTLYHIKRSIATFFFHSLLPAGYTMLLLFYEPRTYFHGFFTLSPLCRTIILFTLVFPFAIALICYYWSCNQWGNHPISLRLRKLAQGSETWQDVARLINMETRNPNLYGAGHYSRKLYVTENWIIKIGTYQLDIAHQQNCVMSLHRSRDLSMSLDNPHGLQLLQIDVKPVDVNIPSFSIHLPSGEFRDLKDHLSAPLVNARNIVIKQNVTELFLDAFKTQVDQNPRYRYDSALQGDLDQCLGCMLVRANVKLVKHCEDTPGQEMCVQCHCKPHWCVDCLAKWFASRQNQHITSNWLSCKAGCPMCRARFCMADICHLATTSDDTALT